MDLADTAGERAGFRGTRRARVQSSRKRRIPVPGLTAAAIALALVLLYPAAYLVARASHVLVREGWYYNEVNAMTGRHTARAGWRDQTIEVTQRFPGADGVEAVFSPLIAAECLLWARFGTEPGD